MSSNYANTDTSSENQLYVDLNKVFIPFRPVIEMELVISLFLINSNFNKIKNSSSWQSNKQELYKLLNLEDKSVSKDILDRFFLLLKKLKPVVYQTREIHDFRRAGNVNAYSETRIPGFFALDHLKFKVLLLIKFLKHFKKSNYDLTVFPKYDEAKQKTLKSILFQEYYSRSIVYFNTISPKKEFIGKKTHAKLRGVDTQRLEPMWSFISHTKQNSEVNYIMRGIKGSLFVINTIFAYMDVPLPFEHKDGHMVGVFDALINPDFIPKLIPAMSAALEKENFSQFEDLLQAFEFFTVRIIDGINNAVKIASNNQINLTQNQTLYYTGKMLRF
ncbi:MAG: hypothetical protein ACTSWL_06270 [Promethearchaeota archaeon]